MSTIHARWPTNPIAYTRCRNGETAFSDVLAVPAANNATMRAWVDGVNGYGSPLNPSGEYGHDHSGGHFGRPIFTSIATLSLHGPQGNTKVYYPERFSIYQAFNEAGGITSTREFSPTAIWVPPCDPAVGAYTKLGISARINLVATTLTASDSITVGIRLGNGPKISFQISPVNATGMRLYQTPSLADRISPARVGASNLVTIDVTVIRAAGGASRGCRLDFHELEFGVYQ